jgi:single-stranded-DNA-specific exonuclease
LFEKIPERPEEVNTNDVYYDLEIDISEVDTMLKELEKYAPFGEGNPRIVFKVNNFQLSPRYSSFFNLSGNENQNIKLFGNGIDAMAYDMAQKYADLKEPKHLNLIGSLEINNYMGRSTVQVSVVDMDDAGYKVEKSALAKALEAKAKARYS